MEYSLGVNIFEAPYPFERSRVAVFVPRHIVRNEMCERVLLVQDATYATNVLDCEPQQRKAFYFSNCCTTGSNKRSTSAGHNAMAIRIGLTETENSTNTSLWSLPFSVDNTGLHVLNLRDQHNMKQCERVSLHISLEKV